MWCCVRELEQRQSFMGLKKLSSHWNLCFVYKLWKAPAALVWLCWLSISGSCEGYFLEQTKDFNSLYCESFSLIIRCWTLSKQRRDSVLLFVSISINKYSAHNVLWVIVRCCVCMWIICADNHCVCVVFTVNRLFTSDGWWSMTLFQRSVRSFYCVKTHKIMCK